jgi:hypothetical protein
MGIANDQSIAWGCAKAFRAAIRHEALSLVCPLDCSPAFLGLKHHLRRSVDAFALAIDFGMRL